MAEQNATSSISTTPATSKSFKDWISSLSSTDGTRIYQTKQLIKGVKGLFSEPHWAMVENTNMLVAKVTSSEILDMTKLKATTQLVVVAPTRQLVGGELGQVDLWPDRMANKDGRGWETASEWKDKTLDELRLKLPANFQVLKYGATTRFGRPALRVQLAPKDYMRVAAVAADMQLQFARVSPPNVTAAMLTVKATSGPNEGLPDVLKNACDYIKERYGATFGRADYGPGTVSVVVYTEKVCVAADAFSHLTTDGFRVAFAPTAAGASSIPASEVDEFVSRLPEPGNFDAGDEIDRAEGTASTSASAGDARMAADREYIVENAKSVNEETAKAYEAAIKATKKMVRAWGALRMSTEVVDQTKSVIEKLYKAAVEDFADLENYAAWTNTCPTPAAIEEYAREKKVDTEPLRLALTARLAKPSANAIAETTYAGRNAAKGASAATTQRTYADVAKRRTAAASTKYQK